MTARNREKFFSRKLLAWAVPVALAFIGLMTGRIGEVVWAWFTAGVTAAYIGGNVWSRFAPVLPGGKS